MAVTSYLVPKGSVWTVGYKRRDLDLKIRQNLLTKNNHIRLRLFGITNVVSHVIKESFEIHSCTSLRNPSVHMEPKFFRSIHNVSWYFNRIDVNLPFLDWQYFVGLVLTNFLAILLTAIAAILGSRPLQKNKL